MTYLSGQSDFERLTALLKPSNSEDGCPRPEQGGQRITTEWLETLRPRDCQWRFRYVGIYL